MTPPGGNEERRGGDDLAAALARLDVVLLNAPVGFGFWDADGQVLQTNRELDRIDAMVPDLAPIIGAEIEPVVRDGVPVVDQEIVVGRHHVLLSSYPVQTGDRMVAGVIVVDISDRSRAAIETRVRGSLSDLMNRTLDVRTALHEAAAVMVPDVADVCVIVIDEDGDDLATAHAGAKLDIDEALDDARWERVRAGEIVEIEDGFAVPLRTANRVEGAVVFAGNDIDRTLIATLTARVAELVVQVRLAALAERTQARLELLAAAGAVMEQDLEVASRVEFFTRLLVPGAADRALVFLYEQDQRGLVFAGAADARHDQTSHSPVLDVDGAAPAAVAFRTCEPVVRRFGEDGPVLAVPLRARGRAIGALVLEQDPGHRRFDAADVLLAEELARAVGPALNNARRYEQERLTGETLQRNLLPQTVPAVAGVRLATEYLPGTAGLHVGGDWFDVVDLGRNGLLLAIGDVVGHGIEAAVSMGRFRTALQFAAAQTGEPAEILAAVNRFMGASFRSEMATLCVVRYDPVAGSASAASAGHPPPVLISPNGTSHAAAVVPGLPLGVLAATTYEQATLDLPAGSGLVLYTDGLIERRGEVVDEGLARLITHTTGVLDDAGVLAERVIQHLVPDDGPTDDVALLVMRVGVAGPALSIVIEPDAGELASVRHDVELWVGPTGAADDDIGDLVLAINEAAANAVEHAYVGAHKREQVRVRGTVEKGCVEVTVCDQGTWRAPWGSRHRGRGIDLIRALVDDVDIATTPAGTSVRLRKALFAPLP